MRAVTDGPVPEPARAARAQATRMELLTAAEKLFALNGLMGVSLRQIVAATRQRNLATLHYHFGSREALAHAICDRRMPPIERERALRLAAYVEAPPRADRAVELMRIQLAPSLQPVVASGGRSHFRRFLAHAFVSDTFGLTDYISAHYDLGIRQVAGLMRQEAPHLPREAFAARWTMMIRSTTYLLASLEARVEQVSWRTGEALMWREVDAMSVAFAGMFAAAAAGGEPPAAAGRRRGKA